MNFTYNSTRACWGRLIRSFFCAAATNTIQINRPQRLSFRSDQPESWLRHNATTMSKTASAKNADDVTAVSSQMIEAKKSHNYQIAMRTRNQEVTDSVEAMKLILALNNDDCWQSTGPPYPVFDKSKKKTKPYRYQIMKYNSDCKDRAWCTRRLCWESKGN